MLAKLIELIATYKKLKNQAVSVVTTLVYQTPKALALFGGLSLRLWSLLAKKYSESIEDTFGQKFHFRASYMHCTLAAWMYPHTAIFVYRTDFTLWESPVFSSLFIGSSLINLFSCFALFSLFECISTGFLRLQRADTKDQHQGWYESLLWHLTLVTVFLLPDLLGATSLFNVDTGLNTILVAMVPFTMLLANHNMINAEPFRNFGQFAKEFYNERHIPTETAELVYYRAVILFVMFQQHALAVGNQINEFHETGLLLFDEIYYIGLLVFLWTYRLLFVDFSSVALINAIAFVNLFWTHAVDVRHEVVRWGREMNGRQTVYHWVDSTVAFFEKNTHDTLHALREGLMYDFGHQTIYALMVFAALNVTFFVTGVSLYILQTFKKDITELDSFSGRVGARDIGATFYALSSVVVLLSIVYASYTRTGSQIDIAYLVYNVKPRTHYLPDSVLEIKSWIGSEISRYVEHIRGGNLVDFALNNHGALENVTLLRFYFDMLQLKEEIASQAPVIYKYTLLARVSHTYDVDSYVTFLDGISVWLIWLTAIVGYVTQLALDSEEDNSCVSQSFFLGCVVILSGFCFVTNDLFAFFLAFEAVLVPLFFMVGLHGSRAERIRAAFFLFVFTLVGSTFLWLAVLYASEVLCVTRFDLLSDALSNQSAGTRQVMWWLLFLGFAFKVPLVPFHLWLTVAHVEAPTAGSMLLAGLILKLGGYGMLRFVFLLLPAESAQFSFVVISICCFGYTLATLSAVRQLDIKRFIAYTSIAHMNFGLAVLFTTQKAGFAAFCHTMISHGIIASALFFLIGYFYRQTGLRDTLHVRGLASVVPYFAIAWFIFSMANVGMPLLSGFPGEFYGLLALSMTNRLIMFWFMLGFYFTAVYTFLNVSRVLYGSYVEAFVGHVLDLTKNGHHITIFLAILSHSFGIAPNVLFNTLDLVFYSKEQVIELWMTRRDRSTPSPRTISNMLNVLPLDLHSGWSDASAGSFGWLVDRNPDNNPFAGQTPEQIWADETRLWAHIQQSRPPFPVQGGTPYFVETENAVLDKFRHELLGILNNIRPLGMVYHNFNGLNAHLQARFADMAFGLNPLAGELDTIGAYNIVSPLHIEYMQVWEDGKIAFFADLVYNPYSGLWFDTGRGVYFRAIKGLATVPNLTESLKELPQSVIVHGGSVVPVGVGAADSEAVNRLIAAGVESFHNYLDIEATAVTETAEAKSKYVSDALAARQASIKRALATIGKVKDDSSVVHIHDHIVQGTDKLEVSKRYFSFDGTDAIADHVELLNKQLTCNKYKVSIVFGRNIDSIYSETFPINELVTTFFKKCAEMSGSVVLPCDTCPGGYRVVNPENARIAVELTSQRVEAPEPSKWQLELKRKREEYDNTIIRLPSLDDATKLCEVTPLEAALRLYPGSAASKDNPTNVEVPCEECPSGFRVINVSEAFAELIKGGIHESVVSLTVPDVESPKGRRSIKMQEAVDMIIRDGITGGMGHDKWELLGSLAATPAPKVGVETAVEATPVVDKVESLESVASATTDTPSALNSVPDSTNDKSVFPARFLFVMACFKYIRLRGLYLMFIKRKL